MNSQFTKIWEFIRDNLSSLAFEKLIYENKDNVYEDYLGSELYSKCIENSYLDGNSTYLLKEELKEFQRNNYPTKCKCIEMNPPPFI